MFGSALVSMRTLPTPAVRRRGTDRGRCASDRACDRPDRESRLRTAAPAPAVRCRSARARRRRKPQSVSLRRMLASRLTPAKHDRRAEATPMPSTAASQLAFVALDLVAGRRVFAGPRPAFRPAAIEEFVDAVWPLDRAARRSAPAAARVTLSVSSAGSFASAFEHDRAHRPRYAELREARGSEVSGSSIEVARQHAHRRRASNTGRPSGRRTSARRASRRRCAVPRRRRGSARATCSTACRRSRPAGHLVQLARLAQLGQAEVEHLDDVFAARAPQDHDVLGLEVAVDDALLVRLGERAADLDARSCRARRRRSGPWRRISAAEVLAASGTPSPGRSRPSEAPKSKTCTVFGCESRLAMQRFALEARDLWCPGRARP